MSYYIDIEVALEIIRIGDIERLEDLCSSIENFPCGVENGLLSTYWISYAIEFGAVESVIWMLAKGAKLDFEDGQGYTVLHTAIDSESSQKYKMLELLIESGADVNMRGFNDWTPAHLAAARNDVTALMILHRAGADLSRRTRIDDFSTPLELARQIGAAREAVEYLEENI